MKQLSFEFRNYFVERKKYFSYHELNEIIPWPKALVQSEVLTHYGIV